MSDPVNPPSPRSESSGHSDNSARDVLPQGQTTTRAGSSTPNTDYEEIEQSPDTKPRTKSEPQSLSQQRDTSIVSSHSAMAARSNKASKPSVNAGTSPKARTLDAGNKPTNRPKKQLRRFPGDLSAKSSTTEPTEAPEDGQRNTQRKVPQPLPKTWQKMDVDRIFGNPLPGPNPQWSYKMTGSEDDVVRAYTKPTDKSNPTARNEVVLVSQKNAPYSATGVSFATDPQAHARFIMSHHAEAIHRRKQIAKHSEASETIVNRIFNMPATCWKAIWSICKKVYNFLYAYMWYLLLSVIVGLFAWGWTHHWLDEFHLPQVSTPKFSMPEIPAWNSGTPESHAWSTPTWTVNTPDSRTYPDSSPTDHSFDILTDDYTETPHHYTSIVKSVDDPSIELHQPAGNLVAVPTTDTTHTVYAIDTADATDTTAIIKSIDFIGNLDALGNIATMSATGAGDNADFTSNADYFAVLEDVENIDAPETVGITETIETADTIETVIMTEASLPGACSPGLPKHNLRVPSFDYSAARRHLSKIGPWSQQMRQSWPEMTFDGSWVLSFLRQLRDPQVVNVVTVVLGILFFYWLYLIYQALFSKVKIQRAKSDIRLRPEVTEAAEVTADEVPTTNEDTNGAVDHSTSNIETNPVPATVKAPPIVDQSVHILALPFPILNWCFKKARWVGKSLSDNGKMLWDFTRKIKERALNASFGRVASGISWSILFIVWSVILFAIGFFCGLGVRDFWDGLQKVVIEVTPCND